MDFSNKELEAFERLMDPERTVKYQDDRPGCLGLLIEQNDKQCPDKTAIYFEDKELSYKDLNTGCNKVANHFLSIGAQKGDVCALFLENSIDYIMAFAGLSKIGVISSLLNTNLKRRPLIHVMNISHADYLLVHENLLDAISEVLDELNISNENMWIWGDGRDATPYNDFKKAFNHASPDNPPTTCNTLMKDIIFYFFTSGTTGLPKAVRMKARNQIDSGELVFKVATQCSPEDTIYAPLPLNHVWGMISLAGALGLGSSFVFRKKFSAREYWQDVRKFNVTVGTYIGEIPSYLFSQPEKAEDGDNPLKKFLGLGLKAEIWEKFKERFGIEDIIEFYGASEIRGSLVNIPGKPGMIGRILNEAIGAVVKYDLEKEALIQNNEGYLTRCTEPGDLGIYIINGDNRSINLNEYTDPKDTEKKILRDVFQKDDIWFSTGDLLEVHEDGWLSFSDRLGDTFRWKSENVSTQEVESILMSYKHVKLTTVYGVSVSGLPGQAGMACIVKKIDAPWEWKDFRDFVKANLPSYAIPRFIRFRDQLEMTATLKIKKVNLRKQGFDPFIIQDILFYWNNEKKGYVELDQKDYGLILSGKISL